MRSLRTFIANIKKSSTSKQRGFTLIELIIYMGILIILFSVLSNIFLTSLETQMESEMSSAVDQDSRFLSNRLAYDIMRAQSITTPGALGATSSSLVLVISGQTHTYAVNVNGDLTLTNAFGVNRLHSIDTSISNFSVTKLGNVGGVEQTARITYTLTSRYIRAAGPLQNDYSITVALRRK